MKLGMLTAILDQSTYEEAVDTAAGLGFSCVEVAAWPQGRVERRYAGVSHIDAERVNADAAYAEHLRSYAAAHGVEISALGYYPNMLDPDPARRAAFAAHVVELVHAAAKLGVPLVDTFIGRDQTKTVEENLKVVSEVWPAILAEAEAAGVRIAIENCPMLFGPDQWPGGQNLFTSPANWERVFNALDSDVLGINYDPSHFVWQQLDYIAPIYEFSDKIFHVHFKDIKLYPRKLARVGTMAYPLEYMEPKLPGLGDVRWGEFVSALTDVGYCGCACIEMEDRAFEGAPGRIEAGLALAKRYMEQFVI